MIHIKDAVDNNFLPIHQADMSFGYLYEDVQPNFFHLRELPL